MNSITKKGNDRIKAAMRENEQYLLGRIRKDGSWRPFACGMVPVRMWNAIDRLEAKGKVRYSHARGHEGYVLRTKKTK